MGLCTKKLAYIYPPKFIPALHFSPLNLSPVSAYPKEFFAQSLAVHEVIFLLADLPLMTFVRIGGLTM